MRILKNSSGKNYNDDHANLLRTELARALRQRPEKKHVRMFNEKVVLTISNE